MKTKERMTEEELIEILKRTIFFKNNGINSSELTYRLRKEQDKIKFLTKILQGKLK